MKSAINFHLARSPKLYRLLLSLANAGSDEKRAFLGLLNNGDITCDIGANRGAFTVLFSHIVGATGQVHAFEPVPQTFQMLQSHVKRETRFSNVVLNNCALGNSPGKISLHMPGGDDGQASMRQHSSGSWERPGVQSFECEMVTLDQYISNTQLDRLNFIKLDVEGAELLTLQGGSRTITRFQPVLHLEYCNAWTEAFGYSAVELFGLLRDLGYKRFCDDKLEEIHNFPDTLRGSRDSHNITCFF